MEAQNADLSALRIDRQKESEESGKSKRTTWLVSAVVILAIILAAYFALGNALTQAVEVSLTTVALSSPSQSNAVLTASGYVVAQRKASVASKATGRLVYLGVVEGDKVKKDQLIARLEDSDMMAALEQAKANLNMNQADLISAERALKRQKSLFEKGLSTQADYDAADALFRRVLASIDVAKAMVTGQEVALENTRVRAPFDGTVLSKSADVGEMVVPMAASVGSKSAVVTIADMSSLQVEADVSESNIEKLKPGQPCEIQLDAVPDERFSGTIHMIVPTADRSKATVMVKVRFNTIDNRILPEMSAKVAFLSREVKKEEETARTAVSPKAIIDDGGKKFLFVVKQNRVKLTPVTVGAPLGDMVEILSGAVSGDKVVINPPKSLKDNARIKIAEQ